MSETATESALGQRVGSLMNRTLSAGVWVGSGAILGNVIRLLANLIVARLLFPEAFGLMVIATTITVILAMLSDVGIQQSIIRGTRGEDPLYLDTAWTFQILRGLVLCFGICSVAVVLALLVANEWIPKDSTYASQDLPWIMVVISLSAVIQGFQSTDLATASRRLTMKPVVVMELAVALISVIIMCALAWWLRSVWALVMSSLLSAILYVAASHLVLGARRHRHRLRIDQSAMNDLFGFGKWVALSSSVSVFVSNGDRLLLGAMVTAPVLGLFSIASSLATVLDQALGTVFGRVVLPALSEVARNRPEQLAHTYYRLRWRLDPGVLLIAGTMFALGPTIIRVLYDSRYLQAGEMLQILSLGLLFSRLSLVQQVYLALNEPRYQVVLNAVRAVSLYASVPIAFKYYGINGALMAIALRELPVLPLIFWFNSKHGLNNFRIELLWLAFWPAGWCLGEGLRIAISWFMHYSL